MFKLNINNLYGDEDFIMVCPNCLHEFLVKLREVSNLDNKIICPNCNFVIKVGEDAEIKKIIDEINKSLTDTEKVINKIFK